MKNIRNIFYLLIFYLLTFSSASAHVKWFVPDEEIIEESHGLTPFYNIQSKEVLIWAGVVFIMVLLGAYLDRIIKTPKKITEFSFKYEKQINRGAQALLGIFMLVTVNFFWDTIIIPYVASPNTFKYLIQSMQVLIGAMFLFNFRPRIASMLLMALCVALGIWSGPITFAENLLLLSVAFYFFIKNSPTDSKTFRLNKYAVEILRVGTGICLIVLAFTEKLAYPELSLVFLQAHPWNFMQPFFPNFTDSLFVLSVGASELIFGIMFIMGYLTRVTTIFLTVFLLSSATAMFLSVGDWEPGHVVIYAAAFLFLAFGHGHTKFFHFNLFKKS
ncbi:MAG: DoxX family membrane protein [Candidatus Nomurabacteria bacterium]|nr:DoxX family membrane protein [Candidatus Nomurabacteria bacterium]